MDIRSAARSILVVGAAATAGLTLSACMSSRNLAKSSVCGDFSFPVYFGDRSDQLTTSALQAIAASATRARRCPIDGLAIGGLGDDGVGLADRRAAAVVKALAANGLVAPAPIVRPTRPLPGFALPRHGSEVSLHFATAQ